MNGYRALSGSSRATVRDAVEFFNSIAIEREVEEGPLSMDQGSIYLISDHDRLFDPRRKAGILNTLGDR